jgi:F420-dependent oxidoreductase-like protein
MRISLFLNDSGEQRQLVSDAVNAERDGFAGAWYPQIFGLDSLTTIALAGRETESIELGTCVVPVQTRHPFSFAQQTAAVGDATGGRFVLGIGLSHQPVVEGMWGLSYDKPARHMREYLSVLRPLLDEGKVAFSGDVFRVNANIQKPAKPVSVLIAALSPIMLRIAGDLADGTITWMTGARTIKEHTAPALAAASKAAGRNATRICAGIPVAVTDDAAAARERAARFFQVYGHLPNYQRMLKREGVEGPAGIAVVGNEQEVEAQLRALAEAGATDLLAAMFPADDDAATSIARTRELLKGLVGKI